MNGGMGQLGPGPDIWSEVPKIVIWLVIIELIVFTVAVYEISQGINTSPAAMWIFLSTAWLPAAILVYYSATRPKYAIAFGITAAGIFVFYATLCVIILLVAFVNTT